MTNMTPEEINRRIATWAGLDSHVCDGWSFHCDDCERGSIQTPDYYHTNAAMDLLGVLVEMGYKCRLLVSFRGVEAGITRLGSGWNHPTNAVNASAGTIPAAICTAIIELIEREAAE